MNPLGKNIGGYFGEKIDMTFVQGEIERVSRENGWQYDFFYVNKGFKFLGLTKVGSKTGKNIYISAGIHGDEPASVLAALQLIRENNWPDGSNIFLCPCLNPLGNAACTRTNERNIDLNRDYKSKKEPETRAHIAWLDAQPTFDLSLSLHEDWEAKGFYMYDKNDDSDFSASIIKAVAKIFPIDMSEKIEGFSARGGIISPPADREMPEWPEALYLIRKKGGRHYTFEASSDFPLDARVNALVAATKAACDLISAR